MSAPTPERPESPSPEALELAKWIGAECTDWNGDMDAYQADVAALRIDSALAPAREQGRREGLEQAARWHAVAQDRNPQGLLALAHQDAAECLRALAQEEPKG